MLVTAAKRYAVAVRAVGFAFAATLLLPPVVPQEVSTRSSCRP